MNTKKTATVTIGTVFYNLLNKHLAVDSPEEQLVVEALRRSNSSLSDASLTDLGDYIAGLTPEQIKGLANNIRGIYHELLFVDEYNKSHDDGTVAEVFGSTNHAGADVKILDAEGNQLEAIQLKATDSTSYLTEHIERYPDIGVAATEEVAQQLENVSSTGLKNADIHADVAIQFDQLDDLDSVDQAVGSVGASGLLAASLRAGQVIRGQAKAPEAAKQALGDIAIATSSTALVTWLFG